MAEDLGTASLGLEADQTQLKRDLAAAKSTTAKAGADAGKGFKQGLEKTAVPAALVLGAVAVGAKKVIGAASDMNEAVSAVNTTFGKSSDAVQKWSEDQDDAFSRVDYLTAAKSFAVFGQAADLNGDQLSDFSKKLIDAAGDMASFHNADPSQVLEDLRSGLAGETEPLRKYGIILNDAALKEEAYREGIAKRGSELTEQQKVLARQSFILHNLGAAQGDYQRTAEGTANTERRLAANAADTQATLGQGLLPVYDALLAVVGEVGGVMADHTTAVTIAVAALAGLAAAVLIVNAGLKVYKAAQTAATAATWLWNIALRANPIVLIVTLLVALGLALVVAWKKSETFRKIVLGAWDAVKTGVVAVLNFFTQRIPAAFQRVLSWVRSNWPKIAVFISGPFAPLVLLATDAFGIRSKLIGALQGLLDKAKSIASSIGSGIKSGIVNALSGLGGLVTGIAKGAINGLIGVWNNFGIPGFDINLPGPVDFHFGGASLPDIPYLDRGGVIPGPLGRHRLVWAAGGETVLPTHRGAPGRGATIAILDGDRETINWLRNMLGGWSADNGGRMAW